MTRTDELAANLAEVRIRIADACAEAGRAPDEVTLIAVTKTWPADDVRRLAELGVTDLGENRDQEAAPKAALLTDLDLTWHFIGALQANKAASVVAYADVVHSVDRLRLVEVLSRAAERSGKTLDVLLQVSLDGDPRRGGVGPQDVPALAAAAVEAGLRLRGLMAVAPLGEEPDRAFARLEPVRAELVREHPGATWLSAGMSGDFAAGIRAGATHLRIGTALLGRRPALG